MIVLHFFHRGFDAIHQSDAASPHKFRRSAQLGKKDRQTTRHGLDHCVWADVSLSRVHKHVSLLPEKPCDLIVRQSSQQPNPAAWNVFGPNARVMALNPREE